ncbi:glycoside hydrolase family 2 TIM barrel-domain containing protein [Sphingobacterium paramultivorum]|uniref:glycoside hydrolase family 2 TIM barrel-domain containing protein n=1 Tax=Sphingobacterium paramultivorum TaxID=2886510 RepID=UPI0018928574|nr:glycoside hydrolase family 2 TIM barrel-domain containing protein [Sphingobacterium paramultivorum]
MLKRLFHTGYSRMMILLFLLLATAGSLSGQSRKVIDFNGGWWFKLDSSQQYSNGRKGEGWRKLDLPHDWSIEMPFRENSPAGSGAAYLDGGVGWYQKTFKLAPAEQGQRIFIAFEGVYENSEVWINGHFLGKRPNGYIGFEYELSPYLYWDGRDNLLSVKVNNKNQPNSRFYSGSGIYRDVKLISRNSVSIGTNSTFIRAGQLSEKRAVVDLSLEIEHSPEESKKITLLTEVLSAQGAVVASKRTTLSAVKAGLHSIAQQIVLENPVLWGIENPYQYTAKIKLIVDGRVVDEQRTKFGLRNFSFDQQRGFILNGRQLKIRGVCLHSDLGALGMAFNTSAALRQLRIMKAMGVNGIRTSHNPAAPAFLDLCDSLGFVVMSETFDVWKGHKNPYDYHLYWDEWYKRDFVDHVKRDRNHPSLFIWCLGNEAQEQWHSKADGTAIPIALAAIVDSLDGTRPTTIANNELSKANPVLMSSAVDLIGYNYNHKKWASFPQDHPGKKFIVTESTSALESRGTYDLVPYDSSRMWPERWDIPFSGGNEDRNISAYDNVFTPWGSDHQTSLRLMERYDHIAGMYVWTGFDYLGEPTPYTWPARSSYFGIVDLAGFPKDVYYLYQSVWTEKPVLYVLPHWNWKQGDRVDIVVYFNQADRVELYLNRKKIGEQSKDPDRYDLVFKAVEFEPGEIEVISFQGGKKLLSKTIRTAAKAHRIQLSSENVTFNSANKELAFVHAYIVDEFGTIVPDADDKIEFEVEGDGAKIVATDNGNTTDLTSFQSASRNAFHGKVLAIVRSKNKGKIRVRAKSEGLISGDIQLEAN